MQKIHNTSSSFKRILLATTILLSAHSAFAHIHLMSASPAINATTSVTPTKLTLNFADEVMLMSIKVVDAQQQNVPLNYEINHGMKKSFDVPLTLSAKGKYTVTWGAMGNDGHNMTGDYSFTVEPTK